MKTQLLEIREWAVQKIQAGQEPPWAWYQYTKLIETVDAILAGMGAVNPTENSLQSTVQAGTPLRLVDATYRPDTLQPHQDVVKIQEPM